MQQYYYTDDKILTVFHTEDRVAFNVEHYGGFSISVEELLVFLESSEERFEVFENPAERYPELAEKHPVTYSDEEIFRGWIEQETDGSLRIYIDGKQNEIVVSLTPEQAVVLEESCEVGQVDRYDDGSYPVESVSQDGVRDRAEHTT